MKRDSRFIGTALQVNVVTYFRMERSGIERESGRHRLGCTSICLRDGSNPEDRCRGGVSDSGLLRRGEPSVLCCRRYGLHLLSEMKELLLSQ